mgnify:CR=1 FL=1
MARLLGGSAAAVQGDRVAAVRTWLDGRESATLVLKGAATLVGDGERLAFNTSGNPGMAAAARDEGFDEIADWFETLGKAERSHANRFQKALDELD